ncbi:MAG TPA: hypothetical protein PL105_00270 [Caldilineaceae bacterium]|nr:hypothetical protein [Caldilineaceae bacterium]
MGKEHSQYGYMAEGLVLFTSPEVADGSVKAFEAQYNIYGSLQGRKSWPNDRESAISIIEYFLRQESPETAIYVVPVNINDFSACFDAVARATLKFHRPGKTGKHIWANITGGSNMLNTAITQTAYLSGFIVRMYYTFVSDLRTYGKYLQPFGTNPTQFRFDHIFALKTGFGQRHQIMLEVLEQIEHESPGRFAMASEVLSRLKGHAATEFGAMDLQTFKRDFLNVMQGYSIEQYGDRQAGQEDGVRLSSDGKSILNLIRQPIMRALVQREQLQEEDIEAIITSLPIQKVR